MTELDPNKKLIDEYLATQNLSPRVKSSYGSHIKHFVSVAEELGHKHLHPVLSNNDTFEEVAQKIKSAAAKGTNKNPESIRISRNMKNWYNGRPTGITVYSTDEKRIDILTYLNQIKYANQTLYELGSAMIIAQERGEAARTPVRACAGAAG